MPFEFPQRSFPEDVTSSLPLQARGSSAEPERAPRDAHPVEQKPPQPHRGRDTDFLDKEKIPVPA